LKTIRFRAAIGFASARLSFRVLCSESFQDSERTRIPVADKRSCPSVLSYCISHFSIYPERSGFLWEAMARCDSVRVNCIPPTATSILAQLRSQAVHIWEALQDANQSWTRDPDMLTVFPLNCWLPLDQSLCFVFMILWRLERLQDIIMIVGNNLLWHHNSISIPVSSTSVFVLHLIIIRSFSFSSHSHSSLKQQALLQFLIDFVERPSTFFQTFQNSFISNTSTNHPK
jgi:hypothetical protein